MLGSNPCLELSPHPKSVQLYGYHIKLQAVQINISPPTPTPSYQSPSYQFCSYVHSKTRNCSYTFLSLEPYGHLPLPGHLLLRMTYIFALLWMTYIYIFFFLSRRYLELISSILLSLPFLACVVFNLYPYSWVFLGSLTLATFHWESSYIFLLVKLS